MYLHGDDELREIQAQQMALAGFNPLKALGRALGSTGRALVGTLIPGGGVVSKVLDVAARSPAGSGPAIAAAIQTATAPPAPTPSAAPVGDRQPRQQGQRRMMQQQQPSADFLTQFMQKMQPAAGGGAAGPVISVSSPGGIMPPQVQYAQPAPSAMPSWLIPAGIAGLAAVLLLNKSGGSRR